MSSNMVTIKGDDNRCPKYILGTHDVPNIWMSPDGRYAVIERFVKESYVAVKVEEFIERKYKDGEITDDIKDQMLFDLSYQPTAYDVEAVVAELEDVFPINPYPNEFTNGRDFAIKKAIDIVRKGGGEHGKV